MPFPQGRRRRLIIVRYQFFIAPHQLREHAQASETRLLAAELAERYVEGIESSHRGQRRECAPRAAVGQRVGVGAPPAVGLVHHPRRVVESLLVHAYEVPHGLVDASPGRGDRGVVFDDEPSRVVGFDGRAAVAEPEQVPVVAVRGPGGVTGLFGPGAEDVLARLREEIQLALQRGVPVCIIFHDQGA